MKSLDNFIDVLEKFIDDSIGDSIDVSCIEVWFFYDIYEGGFLCLF